MRLALPSLTLLLCLPALACGAASDASETGSGGSTSTGPNSDATATSPTTEGDPTASASTTTSATADTTGIGATSTGEASTTGETTSGPAQELPPIDSTEALESWLAGGAYKQWAGESQVHASTGPHAGNVRTYVNALALGSLAAQSAEHPEDAATVKELYGAGMDVVIGFAVTRKTAPQSEGGATWYWYERIDATVYGGSLDVPLCTGCHGGGADYILTPYPLQ